MAMVCEKHMYFSNLQEKDEVFIHEKHVCISMLKNIQNFTGRCTLCHIFSYVARKSGLTPIAIIPNNF